MQYFNIHTKLLFVDFWAMFSTSNLELKYTRLLWNKQVANLLNGKYTKAGLLRFKVVLQGSIWATNNFNS